MEGADEEFQELQRAIGGLTPTVHVSVGISGNIAGDSEVRWLARCLLMALASLTTEVILSIPEREPMRNPSLAV